MTVAALTLRGISKRYGAVQALQAVDFTLQPGEIHALLGENGAGKSTLMKVAYGLVRPDRGTMSVGDQLVLPRDPTVARRLGIGMVPQHFTSIPALTVAENLALTAGWPVRPGALRAHALRLMEATGLPIDPALPVHRLSAGLKQRLELLKALAVDARVLLLDEPSAVLSPLEADAFLGRIASLRDAGRSAVLITHRLDEALAVADRVTVLRQGIVVYTGAIADTSAAALATLMLGSAPPARMAAAAPTTGEERIRAGALRLGSLSGSGTGLREATFSVRAGEVVGLAAVEGNGQRELMRVLAGLARAEGGEVAVQAPVSFIPEDRSSEGMIGEFSLTEHLALTQGRRAPWVRGPWIDWRAAAERAAGLIGQYQVRSAGAGATAASLSGGNQQRFLIAAALERRPAVLLAENPTRGLDFRAAAEVQERLVQAARSGAAVLVHLADLDELLAVSDRVLVLAAGRTTELPRTASREEIGRIMLGAEGGQ